MTPEPSALEALGLSKAYGNRQALSGGNRRQVESARAMLQASRVLLMDEATDGLDPGSRRALLRHVRSLRTDAGVGVLWATHLVDEADDADRVVIIDRGRKRVRPSLWLPVFAAGVGGMGDRVARLPSAVGGDCQVYLVPGLAGVVLQFNGMPSSLGLVYDREMGCLRLLLTAPLPRWYLRFGKLVAAAMLSAVQAYAFFAICLLSGVPLPAIGVVTALPALYPLARLRESGAEPLHRLAWLNPFTHAVELVRHAFDGELDAVAAAVVGAVLAVSFIMAVLGYHPQRGLVRAS